MCLFDARRPKIVKLLTFRLFCRLFRPASPLEDYPILIIPAYLPIRRRKRDINNTGIVIFNGIMPKAAIYNIMRLHYDKKQKINYEADDG
jgi:hypothetical protein